MLQVQLVDPAHERQVRSADWPGQVLHRASADIQQLRLARDGEGVVPLAFGGGAQAAEPVDLAPLLIPFISDR